MQKSRKIFAEVEILQYIIGMNSISNIVGRFAPSPTGSLHLGNALSFLCAYLAAKSRGGELVLRIEDLGDSRYEDHIDQVCADLKYLGLAADRGYGVSADPENYLQSRRRGVYRRALQKLIAAQLVYPCVCSRRDAGNAAPHAQDYSVYDGRCRGKFASYAAAQKFIEEKGNSHRALWRFQAPSEPIEFIDRIMGRQRFDLKKTSGDFPLARDADGAGYQLAVVADDIDMGVNQVVRGADLLECTPWQILIYRALGEERRIPEYFHVPPVLDGDGRRMSKRDGDLSLQTLAARGVKPERVLGVLGFFAGMNGFGCDAGLLQLLERFDPAGLRRAHPAVDPEVMQWLLS